MSLGINEIAALPMVMREQGSATRREFEKILVKEGIDPQQLSIVGLFGSADAVKQAVKKGMGISIISRRAVRDELICNLVSEIKIKDTEVIVDNEASADNLTWFAKSNAFFSERVRDGKNWRVKIVKGYACAPTTAPQKAPRAEKDLLLVVGTDTMGKEEELGKVLMKAYFETMKTYKQMPHTIFFLNAGVNLTTTNADICPILKEIETMGVEIYSCGTCLKHYGLEDKLKVGHRGTTNHIIEGMKDFTKTVWIG